MTRAAIDIGSNSLLLLIVNEQGDVLRDLSRIVGLGRGLGDHGRFAPDRMEAAIQVLSEFSQEVQAHGISPSDVQVAATSAARRARNSTDFTERVLAETGLKLQVVTGEREAQLTWMGAREGLSLPQGPVGVIDLGGGSTEIVIGEGPTIVSARSLEIGTVRLTEQVCTTAPDRFTPTHREELWALAHAEAERLEWPVRPQALVGVAGTATTLAASDLGLLHWDAQAVHGSSLTRSSLQRWTERLIGPDLRAREEMVPTSPERANTVLAGACILLAICQVAEVDELQISVGGIRHGLVSSKDVNKA